MNGTGTIPSASALACLQEKSRKTRSGTHGLARGVAFPKAAPITNILTSKSADVSANIRFALLISFLIPRHANASASKTRSAKSTSIGTTNTACAGALPKYALKPSTGMRPAAHAGVGKLSVTRPSTLTTDDVVASASQLTAMPRGWVTTNCRSRSGSTTPTAPASASTQRILRMTTTTSGSSI